LVVFLTAIVVMWSSESAVNDAMLKASLHLCCTWLMKLAAVVIKTQMPMLLWSARRKVVDHSEAFVVIAGCDCM